MRGFGSVDGWISATRMLPPGLTAPEVVCEPPLVASVPPLLLPPHAAARNETSGMDMPTTLPRGRTPAA
jgi:hypothetical protein